MFSLYKLQHPDAVKRVRDSIKRGYSLNSKQARDMILASIVKPSLVAKSLSEAQMDIEDV
jgi:hypothetical protein